MNLGSEPPYYQGTSVQRDDHLPSTPVESFLCGHSFPGTSGPPCVYAEQVPETLESSQAKKLQVLAVRSLDGMN